MVGFVQALVAILVALRPLYDIIFPLVFAWIAYIYNSNVHNARVRSTLYSLMLAAEQRFKKSDTTGLLRKSQVIAQMVNKFHLNPEDVSTMIESLVPAVNAGVVHLASDIAPSHTDISSTGLAYVNPIQAKAPESTAPTS